MMPVIIDHRYLRALKLDLKAPAGPPEGLQCPGDVREGNTELACQRDHSNGVADIVNAGHLQTGFPQKCATLPDFEFRTEFGADDISKLVIGRIGHAVGDSVGQPAAQPGSLSIIAAINDFAAGLRDELAEHTNDSREVGIEVEVFLFDVKNDCVLRPVIAQSAVTFITLGHKIFASFVPVSVGTKDRNLRSDIVRWSQTAGAQYMSSHRRGGCLAVHSRHDNTPLGGHDSRQGIGATNHGKSQPHRFVEGRVPRLDRRGINNKLRALHRVGGLGQMKFEAQRFQTANLQSAYAVAAANLMSQRQQQTSDSAHAGSCNSDEVDTLWSIEQQLGVFPWN